MERQRERELLMRRDGPVSECPPYPPKERSPFSQSVLHSPSNRSPLLTQLDLDHRDRSGALPCPRTRRANRRSLTISVILLA
mmetsp:Transcript_13553/g.26897  ORF Transcript_13553/g.26897 Transcript_13553/m.26897 type:complete len:82 (-) Transcript_13553:625-870(-)